MYLLPFYILLLTAFLCNSSNNNKKILNIFHPPLSPWRCNGFIAMPEGHAWMRSSRIKLSAWFSSIVLYLSSRLPGVLSCFNWLRHWTMAWKKTCILCNECEERKCHHPQLRWTKPKGKKFSWEQKECDINNKFL